MYSSVNDLQNASFFRYIDIVEVLVATGANFALIDHEGKYVTFVYL